jgi:hypothetical protein
MNEHILAIMTAAFKLELARAMMSGAALAQQHSCQLRRHQSGMQPKGDFADTKPTFDAARVIVNITVNDHLASNFLTLTRVLCCLHLLEPPGKLAGQRMMRMHAKRPSHVGRNAF